MTPSNGSGDRDIDILIDQVGRLTEAVTVGFAELRAISERQERNISRLVDTVARQAELVEALIKERQR